MSRRAYALFAESLFPPPPNLIPSFRLWHYPVAGRQLSWTVFHPRIDTPNADVPIVRRLKWDRDGDLERLHLGVLRRRSLKPTVVAAEAPLDPKRLASFAEEANGLSVPNGFPCDPYLSDHRKEFGLEGFDIEGLDGRPIVRIEWDRSKPVELADLTGWSDRVRSWLQEIMPV